MYVGPNFSSQISSWAFAFQTNFRRRHKSCWPKWYKYPSATLSGQNALAMSISRFRSLLICLAASSCAAFSAHDAQPLENPEETGAYLEGDMKGGAEQIHLIERNGILNGSYRWSGAVIPYEIKGPFSTQELAVIAHAFSEYHKKTCIRFRRRTNENDYIVITRAGSGCWSSVGRQGGRQEVNLESGKCFATYGTAIHELMHAVGFYHEQNRNDRDSYVRVLGENVKPGMMVNFQKLPFSIATEFGAPYDYASVMHYKATSFSKNGKPTLLALKPTPPSVRMGQRLGFSSDDIRKINAMYKCT